MPRRVSVRVKTKQNKKIKKNDCIYKKSLNFFHSWFANSQPLTFEGMVGPKLHPTLGQIKELF